MENLEYNASRMVRVRFAPSPTGIPHVGNTRTALLNFLFARHNNGKFILRIEDTDRKRFVKESETAIYKILEWLGLDFDEKYIQSKRLDIYKEHAEILKKKKIVYEEADALKFAMPKTGETSWQDAVGSKEIVFKNSTQEDFVIIKSDGYPTYNFANVVDDHLMKITHVIRGEEFISSTPKHVQLYRSLSWGQPIFAHLPVILGQDKSKLSKRHGAKSALDYRKEGYLTEALLNFMALLGWNPGGDREILSLEEMIKLFSLEDINTANPIFDIKKLEWLNGVWIRKLSVEQLKKRLLEFSPEISEIRFFGKYISLAQSRMKTLPDFRNLAEDKNVLLSENQKKLAIDLKKRYQLLSPWRAAKISEETIKVRNRLGSSTKDVYTVLTGKSQGLPFEKKLEIKGKAETISNLEQIIK